MAAHKRYVEALLRSIGSPASRLDLTSFASLLSGVAGAPLDHLYSRLGSFNGPFFPGGWGNLGVVNYAEDIKHLLDVGPSGPMKVRESRVDAKAAIQF